MTGAGRRRDPVPETPWAARTLIAALLLSIFGVISIAHRVIPAAHVDSFFFRLPSSTTQEAADARGHRLEADDDTVYMYVTAAVPFFIILMLVEALLLRLARQESVAAQYTVLDTWSSLAAGTSQQLVKIVYDRLVPVLAAHVGVRGLTSYCADHADGAICSVTNVMRDASPLVSLARVGVMAYPIAFLFGDFVYYWFHRCAHERAILWAGHGLHHSSEHFNLSTAVRQSGWQSIASPLWSLPAALLFSPAVYFNTQQWVVLYQFWYHTCLVRRLPALFEFLLCTASHHRIHHDRRLHKNFGGVLIIWDRMFGTFHDELYDAEEEDGARRATSRDEPCLFGAHDAIHTWSEAALQYQYFRDHILSRIPTAGIVKAFFVGPGYSTTTVRRPLPMAGTLDGTVGQNRRFRVEAEGGGDGVRGSNIQVLLRVTVCVWYVWVLVGFGSLAATAGKTRDEIDMWRRVVVPALFYVAALGAQGLSLDVLSPLEGAQQQRGAVCKALVTVGAQCALLMFWPASAPALAPFAFEVHLSAVIVLTAVGLF